MEEIDITYSWTKFSRVSEIPKEITNILLEIYSQLSLLKINIDLKETRLKSQRCNDLIIQFICLLFFNPNNIPLFNNKRFDNWSEVYNCYGNPEEIILSMKDLSIPENIVKLLVSENFSKKEKIWNSPLKTMNWGAIADQLSTKFQWERSYNDSKLKKKGIISLEIFDEITAQLKTHESSTKCNWGVVYTPYPLAAHITEESLLNWIKITFHGFNEFNSLSDCQQGILEQDEELKSLFLRTFERIKILDPATGTGVFLFAAAKQMLNISKQLKPKISTQKLKIKIVKNNLFGLDTDPLAIKITSLKFWLWINCQEDRDLKADCSFKCNIIEGDSLFGFQTLPSDFGNNNLPKMKLKQRKDLLNDQYDLKMLNQFVLYELTMPPKSFRNLRYLGMVLEEFLKKNTIKYFILEGDRARWNNEKHKLDKKIRKYIRFSLSQSPSSSYTLYAVFTHPLNSEEDAISSSKVICKAYSIPKKFHWINFGDNTQEFDLIVGNPPYIALTDLPTTTRKMLHVEYPIIYTGNNDLSYFFIYRAISALRADNGILSFILPKYLLHSVYATKIREFILQSSGIIQIYDLAMFSIFKKANIKNIILFLKKGSFSSNQSFAYHKYHKGIDKVIRETKRIYQSDLRPEKWKLLDPQTLKLLNHIKLVSNMKLNDVSNISKGIETGCDQVFAPKDQYYFSQVLKIDLNHIRSWIKGKDIKRFFVEETGREVLFAPSYREHEIKENNKVMNYLEQNKALLLNRSRVLEFYLWRSGDERKTMEWSSLKIVSPYKASLNTFAIDWRGNLSSKDVVWIIPKQKFSRKDFLLFLVAILNSEVLTYYALNSIKDLGGLFEYYPKQIQNFPLIVPDPAKPEYKSIVEVASKLTDKNASKRKDLEVQLNELIFGLYGLTPDEIHIIKVYLSQNG